MEYITKQVKHASLVVHESFAQHISIKMVAKLHLLVVFVILYFSKASLLQEALARGAEFKSEESDELQVEIGNEEKSNKNSGTKNAKEIGKDSSYKENPNGDPEATIYLETIHKPLDCHSQTKSGKVAVIHYTAWIGDKMFDTTIDALKRYVPFEFIVGTGAVIKGFEEGIKDMCKNEQRKITIPPELGYGEKGAGLIPGNDELRLCLHALQVISYKLA